MNTCPCYSMERAANFNHREGQFQWVIRITRDFFDTMTASRPLKAAAFDTDNSTDLRGRARRRRDQETTGHKKGVRNARSPRESCDDLADYRMYFLSSSSSTTALSRSRPLASSTTIGPLWAWSGRSNRTSSSSVVITV